MSTTVAAAFRATGRSTPKTACQQRLTYGTPTYLLRQAIEGGHAQGYLKAVERDELTDIWADGIQVNSRLAEHKLCLFMIIGVSADGSKELVTLADGYRESVESWADLVQAHSLGAGTLAGVQRPHLVALVRAGANLVNGRLAEGDEDQPTVETSVDVAA